MEAWIPITIVAAFSQNIRSALQKHLTGSLSTGGATQARFLYAIPFAMLYLGVLCYGLGHELPTPKAAFFVYATIGGVSQVIGTALLVALFSLRNFFVGTAYSKTETIQAAILGFFVLADEITLGAVTGICLGIVGILIVSGARNRSSLSEVLHSLRSKAALIGILAGLFFGITAICIRGASLSLSGGYIVQAAFTLAYVLVLQFLLVAIYLVWREPGQMSAVVSNWRISWLVGLTGMVASVGWFTAMTLHNAGHVRALGQVELIFAFLASVIIFKEKSTRIELLGISTIVAGIIVLLLYR